MKKQEGSPKPDGRPEKKWFVSPTAPAEYLRKCQPFPPLLGQLLFNRGVTTQEDIEGYLHRRCKADNPFTLAGMNPAVARIRQALRHNELITIYGDFDADGVTSTALLVETLASLGARVEPYIPHRIDEGYGLHRDALAGLGQAGSRLVITVDCGIRSVEEVAFCRQIGLDIIITDHHSVGPELPPALACINPKREDSTYPFRELAGVGVAFKLAQALLRAELQVPSVRNSAPLSEDDLLDLVALGTIADLAPLVDENRSLVHRGLARINQPASSQRAMRPGLDALIQDARLTAGKITSTHIGFMLGPRLNAAGRLDSAMLSYELLTTQETPIAGQLAGRLSQLNRQRQDLTHAAVERALQALADTPGAGSLLFVSGEDYLPGIVGLVAARLTESFYRPAIVVERGADYSRGSCRSIPEFHITRALDRCSREGLLVRHGGHAVAAGFTVETSRLGELQSTLHEIASQELSGQELHPILQIDAVVDLQELNWATLEFISQLEPFGYGNTAPVLACPDVEVVDVRAVGSGKHLRLVLSDGRRQWHAIAFRMGDYATTLPRKVDIAFQLESDAWNGQARLQLIIQDILPAGQGIPHGRYPIL